MKSLSTVERANLEQYIEIVKALDPELYVIKMALIESGVPPMAIIKIIRSLGNIALGTGYGKVSTIVQGKMITKVMGEESVKINEEIIVDTY